jgi:hypothetical protein
MTDQARVEATVRLWLSALREQSRPVSGDLRVSEPDAAELLGLTPGGLKNKRHEGDSPTAYRIGIAGLGRVSYRLHDLAAWLEAQRFR